MKYVEFEKTSAGLKITLLPEGREFLQELKTEEGWSKGSDEIFTDLIEWQLCNSNWEFVRPEEISALTSSLILSDEADRDDHGNLTKCGNVYWNPNYAVTGEIDELLEKGEFCFSRVP